MRASKIKDKYTEGDKRWAGFEKKDGDEGVLRQPIREYVPGGFTLTDVSEQVA